MAGCCNITHGAYAVQVQQRYSDKRTTEGKQLNRVMGALVKDCGGAQSLTQAQRILLDLIRSKIMILMQLGLFIDKQEHIIDEKGKPLECLGSLHLGYSKSLRQDLETLMGIDRRQARPGRGRSLAKWIEEEQSK